MPVSNNLLECGRSLNKFFCSETSQTAFLCSILCFSLLVFCFSLWGGTGWDGDGS